MLFNSIYKSSLLCLYLLFSLNGLAKLKVNQNATGTLQYHQVYSAGLDHTLTQENPNRSVTVYLPPSYFKETKRRYPVLYLLHGIADTNLVWTNRWDESYGSWGTLNELMDHGIAAQKLIEMIVVMPDMKTKAGGSFYVDSSVTGHWAEFTHKKLVQWTEQKFRTKPGRLNRGVAGHSMGGYGALYMGMYHADVFASVYAMSPALIDWGGDLTSDNPAFKSVLEAKTWLDLDEFYEMAIVCVAQAFSPDPDQPPFYADFPFKLTPNGALVAAGESYVEWSQKLLLNALPRQQQQLKSLQALQFDVGLSDQFAHIPITSATFAEKLQSLGIKHRFMPYDGDHRNQLWGQSGRLYQHVLPLFSSQFKTQTD